MVNDIVYFVAWHSSLRCMPRNDNVRVQLSLGMFITFNSHQLFPSINLPIIFKINLSVSKMSPINVSHSVRLTLKKTKGFFFYNQKRTTKAAITYIEVTGKCSTLIGNQIANNCFLTDNPIYRL